MADTSSSTQTSQAPKQESVASTSRVASYNSSGPRTGYARHYPSCSSSGSAGVGLLAQSFGAMNFQDSLYSSQGLRDHASPSTGNSWSGYNGIPNQYWNANHGVSGQYWNPNSGMVMNGQHLYSTASHTLPAAMFTPNPTHFVAHGHNPVHTKSPMSPGWTPTTHVSGDLPTLITPRRASTSSIENDTPGTPSYPGFHPALGHNGGVTILNRSPSGAFTTPSPLAVLTQWGVPMPKMPDHDPISPRLQMLVTKEPAIPPAIPAPSSPLKPLDRALENTRGETNVYIRGLMPETSDNMLDTWGRRFGDIKSSKSIIDHNTGLCKGFGFVRYHNYKDAEDCIRGFHHLGYEVSFARESFYSKLKAIADDANTNLYVSNLPKSMNEHELASIFTPHKVCSARILRNSNGMGRGVGFARFESRVDCEEIIKVFNNKTITHSGEDHTIQIRYADTQEQKHLKQTTAAARQFRSAEYEYATQAHRQWLNNGRSESITSGGSGPTSNDFESSLGDGSSSQVPRSQTYVDAHFRPLVGQRTPLSVMSTNSANIARGNASLNSTPMAKVGSTDAIDGGVKLGIENKLPRIDVSPTRARVRQEN